MTAKLPHRRTLDDVPSPMLARPEPDPDAMRQGRYISDADGILRAHFEPSPEDDAMPTVVVSGHCFIHYDPAGPNRKIAPDALVAFDVDAERIWAEDRYVLWDVGKAPDFVLEIASRTTYREDLGFKHACYEAMGVTEYWRYDPSAGNFYGYALAGDRLVDGQYQPLNIEILPNGEARGYSPALDLILYADYHRLRFYDPRNREFLRNTAQEKAARLRAEAAQQEELAARLRAEERIRQLERLLPGSAGADSP